MGGQTGLKGALELAGEGVRKKFECELIGANEYAIDLAEDRSKFRDAMTEIGLGSARSDVAHTMDEARRIQQDIGFPVIIRPSSTLGGSGGGIEYNVEEFEGLVMSGLRSEEQTSELQSIH